MEAKAWLCIFGAILINLTLGTFYSMGNIIPYVASYMRKNGNPDVTTEHGAWITAAFLLGQGIFIIAGSQIEHHFDNRVACIVGCILHCTSTFLTICAININFLAVVIIYGFGSGLGCGSAYMASIIAAQKWFPRSKSIFTGVIVAGFGLGGCVFTSLQTLYMNPNNLSQDSSGYFEESIYSRVPNLFLYMGLVFVVMQAVGCILAFPPPQDSKNGHIQNEIRSPGPANNVANSTTIVNSDILPNVSSLQSIFKTKIFYIVGLMMMLVAPGVTFVNSLGKRYGQSYLKDDRFLATVVALASVTNALGRLSWGLLMARLPFSDCYIMKVALFASLIAFFPFGLILSTKTLYLIWMLGLSFGFSGTFVLFPVFIEQVFGPRYHGSIYGILYIFLAIAAILTSFSIQLTIVPALENKKSGNPDDSLFIRLGPCAVISALYILSLVLYASCIPVKKLENSIKRRVDSDLEKTRNTLLNRQDLYPLERGTLAEKTSYSGGSAGSAGSAGNRGIERENSLGSIVRFRDAGLKEENRIKTFGK